MTENRSKNAKKNSNIVEIKYNWCKNKIVFYNNKKTFIKIYTFYFEQNLPLNLEILHFFGYTRNFFYFDKL